MPAILHDSAFGLIVGGAILAAIGLFSYQPIHVKLKRATHKTKGEYVREFNDNNAFAKSRAWIPLVVFRVEGKKYELPARYSEGLSSRTPTPCKVDILYDPYNPHFFYALGPGPHTSALKLRIMIAIGLIVLIFGIVAYFL